MSELSAEQVDAELSTAIFCYDPHDKYPESLPTPEQWAAIVEAAFPPPPMASGTP